MIDQAKISVHAGEGGNGCNSFRGAKRSRSRHPDGGGGGHGGDVIIQVAQNIRSLEHFQYRKIFKAANGRSGQANKKKGADARPCIIKVPAGTLISDLKNNLFLQDLIEDNQQLIVAKGGAGGRGNTRTKSATLGSCGERFKLSLELKVVADAAIVGYPNSGKSSFLAQITSCRPKIAAYPFTTVSPLLGVLDFLDFEQPASLTLVELPGLIKGAHQGKGLGAQFLRHAERAKVLIHLIDMAAQEGRQPISDYQELNQELETYDLKLFAKPQVLVANKMDLASAQPNLKHFSAKIEQKIYPISALEGSGIKELLTCLRGYFREGLSNEEKITG